MTAFLLAAAILTGPPVESTASLTLRVHLGRDFQSRVAAAELARTDHWFWEKRLRIEANYRIATDDDALDYPTWEIGRNQERHRFRTGTFAASGTFMLSLLSIAEIDHWERENPLLLGGIWAEEDELADWSKRQLEELRATRPKEFP